MSERKNEESAAGCFMVPVAIVALLFVLNLIGSVMCHTQERIWRLEHELQLPPIKRRMWAWNFDEYEYQKAAKRAREQKDRAP